jgi:hypothetical protein
MSWKRAKICFPLVEEIYNTAYTNIYNIYNLNDSPQKEKSKKIILKDEYNGFRFTFSKEHLRLHKINNIRKKSGRDVYILQPEKEKIYKKPPKFI